MWRIRSSSLSCSVILDFRLSQHPLPEEPAQEARSIEIHLATDDLGQLTFPIEEFPPWHMPLLEFHQDIHVAVRPEIVPEDRAEKGQPPDMVSPAELGDLCFIDLYASAHFTLSIQHAPPEDYRKGPGRKRQ